MRWGPDLSARRRARIRRSWGGGGLGGRAPGPAGAVGPAVRAELGVAVPPLVGALAGDPHGGGGMRHRHAVPPSPERPAQLSASSRDPMTLSELPFGRGWRAFWLAFFRDSMALSTTLSPPAVWTSRKSRAWRTQQSLASSTSSKVLVTQASAASFWMPNWPAGRGASSTGWGLGGVDEYPLAVVAGKVQRLVGERDATDEGVADGLAARPVELDVVDGPSTRICHSVLTAHRATACLRAGDAAGGPPGRSSRQPERRTRSVISSRLSYRAPTDQARSGGPFIRRRASAGLSLRIQW